MALPYLVDAVKAVLALVVVVGLKELATGSVGVDARLYRRLDEHDHRMLEHVLKKEVDAYQVPNARTALLHLGRQHDRQGIRKQIIGAAVVQVVHLLAVDRPLVLENGHHLVSQNRVFFNLDRFGKVIRPQKELFQVRFDGHFDHAHGPSGWYA